MFDGVLDVVREWESASKAICRLWLQQKHGVVEDEEEVVSGSLSQGC